MSDFWQIESSLTQLFKEAANVGLLLVFEDEGKRKVIRNVNPDLKDFCKNDLKKALSKCDIAFSKPQPDGKLTDDKMPSLKILLDENAEEYEEDTRRIVRSINGISNLRQNVLLSIRGLANRHSSFYIGKMASYLDNFWGLLKDAVSFAICSIKENNANSANVFNEAVRSFAKELNDMLKESFSDRVKLNEDSFEDVILNGKTYRSFTFYIDTKTRKNVLSMLKLENIIDAKFAETVKESCYKDKIVKILYEMNFGFERLEDSWDFKLQFKLMDPNGNYIYNGQPSRANRFAVLVKSGCFSAIGIDSAASVLPEM